MSDDNEKQMITLPNGKEIRIYLDNNNSFVFPSVTSLTGIEEKKEITKWKQNNPHWEDILVYAGTVGTITHYRISAELCEEWGYPNEPLDLTPKQQKALSLWSEEFPYDTKRWGITHAVKMNMVCYADWKEHYNPKPPIMDSSNFIPSESRLKSRLFLYGGTCDLICSINGLNYIIDFKTNNYYNYYMQLTAYRLALFEMYPNIRIDKMAIVNVSQTALDYKMTELIYDKKMWLKYLADFYKKYGDMPPFNKNKEYVLNNIKKENGFSI